MSNRKTVVFWISLVALVSGAILGAAVLGGTAAADTDAEFVVSDPDISESSITEGESVDVTATVENVGNESGEYTVVLQANGEDRGETTVSLDAGDSTQVEFTERFDEADDYDISVDGEFAGELTVEEPQTADITVDDAALSTEEITVGESVDVTAELTNDGDATGTFTAELEVHSDVDDSEDVEVAPGETETVRFTETFEETGTFPVAVSGESAGDLTVSDADEPAAFEVSDAQLDEETIEVDDTAVLSADVANVGDEDGTFDAEFRANEAVVDSQEVPLAGGDSETVTLSSSFSDPGEYEVQFSETAVGTLSVEPPASPDIQIREITLSDDEIEIGEPLEVTVEVANDGDAQGTFTGNLEVGEAGVVDTEEVSVPPGETRTTTLTHTPEASGTYSVAVNGESAGELEVVEPAPDVEVTDVTVSDDEVEVGESVDVSVEARNDGDAAGTLSVALEGDDGSEIRRETVDIDPDETETVEFSETLETGGTYELRGNGERLRTIEVLEPESVSVVSANLSKPAVVTGETVEVSAVFENDGDVEGTVDAELRAGDTTINTESVTVDGGETETVTFTESFDEPDTYDLSVNGESAGVLEVTEPASPDVSVAGVSVSDDEIEAGESITVTVDVANDGDASGSITVTVDRADGSGIGSEVVELGPGETDTVTFTESFTTPGTVGLRVNGASAGSIRVLEPADISMGDPQLSDEEIVTGESVTVSAQLDNAGEVAGNFTAQFQVDGDTVDDSDETVGPGGTETVSFDRTFDRTGEYALGINGASAGTVRVLEPADVSLGESSLDSESVGVSDSVRLSIELTNDGEATGQRSLEIDLGDGTTRDQTVDVPANGSVTTITHSYESPGEFTVTVDGQTVGVVTVEEESDSDGSGGSGGGGGTGSAGSTGSGAADSEASTVVRSESDDGVAVSVEGISDGTHEFSVDLAGPGDTQPAVSLSSFTLEADDDRETLDATIGRAAAGPGDRDAVPYGTPFGYVDLSTDIDANATRAATLRFELDQAAFPEGLTSEDVAVLRYANGSWTADGVSHDIDGETHSATLPEATPVAIVALEPGDVEVIDATVPWDSVAAGSEAPVRVTLQNSGDRPDDGTFTVTLDGEPLAEERVTVGPNRTETVDVMIEPTTSGSIEVDGIAAGSFEVFEDDDPRTPDVSDTSEDDTPGFGVIAALIALLAVLFVSRSRLR